MTATPAKYVPRFYSEVVKEVGSPDDCVICASLELYDAATMGEGVTRDDGTSMNTIALRELRDEAGLTPDGPLRLSDAAKYLRYVSTRAGMSPPFELDYYPGHPGGTLRLTWQQFVDRIRNGSVAVLLGNPIGVKDPTSPLRTAQNSDDYGHAIAVMDGTATTARVFDALRYKDPTYRGARVKWEDLEQFTSVKKNGERLYGTPAAIACAIAVIGSETAAARQRREADRVIDRKVRDLAAQKAQTKLATDERDQARRERDAAVERIDAIEAELAACKAATPPDCTAAVNAERQRVLDAMVEALTEAAGSLR